MTHKISRRQFIGEASCAAVGSSSLFSTLLNMKMANAAATLGTSANDDYKALVCLFLAGGNDSFNMLVPMGQNEYAQYATTRSDLALPQGQLLALNGTQEDGRTFGLHPAMPEVQKLYNDGDLAFVANVGTLVEPTTKAKYEAGDVKLPVGLFSHNDQIAHWQTSVPDKRTGIGWGGRTADLLKSLNDNQNISMNISLAGTNTFQAGNTLVDYAIDSQAGSFGIDVYEEGGALNMLKKAAIESMIDLEYQNLFEQTYANQMRTAVDNHTLFSSAISAVPNFTTAFSPGELSQSFQMVAKTIAARQTLGFKRQTFFILMGGWDHHDEVLNNQMAMLSVVSKAMSEFNSVLKELGLQDNVTTFTASDFARTLTSNGRGSDHAWGGNHMVMGGAVGGGKIYGDYPELHIDNALDVGRGSLIPTTSCDEYFAELALWFGVHKSELDRVFPNIGRFYANTATTNPVGFINNNTPVPATNENKVFMPIVAERRNPQLPLGVAGLTALTAGTLSLRNRRINNLDQ